MDDSDTVPTVLRLAVDVRDDDDDHERAETVDVDDEVSLVSSAADELALLPCSSRCTVTCS